MSNTIDDNKIDILYESAKDFFLNKSPASISLLQRHFKIGYSRACALMEQLEKNGVVSKADTPHTDQESISKIYQENNMTKYSKQELKHRALKRIVEVIYGHWEEGRTPHSRLFEVLIPDEYIENGSSGPEASYREHVVPCALIRDECMNMFEQSSSIDEVTNMLDRNLRIVKITTEQANHIDFTLKLKTRMPENWSFSNGDPLARLQEAGINIYE